MYFFNPDLIFLPVLILIGATLYVYILLSKTRVSLFKQGIGKAEDYALNKGEPEESMKINNALSNQFEAPVLFYIVCLSSYMTQTISTLTLVLAFIYAIFKVLHIRLHVTENTVLKRRKMFIKSIYALMALCVVFAVQLIFKQV